MSEQNASGDVEQSSGKQDETDTVETLKARMAAMEKKNAELLGEKKGISEKLSKFEQEKAESEKRLLVEQNKYKEAFERSEKEKLELARKTKSKVMDEQIKRAAVEAKCKHIDAFMKLSAGYEAVVPFDSEINADGKSLVAFIEKQKSEFPFLFAEEKPAIKDGTPSNGTGEIDLAKLGPKEREELKRKLLAGG